MAEQTFKSPNFYEREIDLSAPSLTGPSGVPAAIIGTANKGPAFVPVTVANFNEFVQTFGNLDPKHAGPYAANEFLKHRSALTYLRVLGAGAAENDKDVADSKQLGIVKNAGFLLSGSKTTGVTGDSRNPGVVQFLTAKHKMTSSGSVGFPSMFLDNDTITAVDDVSLVRGIMMTPDTSRIMILPMTSNASTINASTKDSTTVDSSGKFKIVISSSLGASYYVTDGAPGLRVLTASFDPSSKDYFGKILNTDPDKFYQEQHYLHADFAVDTNMAYVKDTYPVAILSGSSNVSSNGEAGRFYRDIFGSYNTRYTTPASPSFISQPFGSTEYDLFHFEALDDGEYANRLYKISISNVKASANDANRYGTFNVQIRDWNDTDTALNVIEQFSNCTLDPDSPNYIAKLIGDRKVTYNFDTMNPEERRLVATGKYNNNSKYVRVVMNPVLEKGDQVPPNALPFGFRGPSLLNVNPMKKDSDVLLPADSRLAGVLTSNALSLTGSFLPPIPYRFKVTRGEVSGQGYGKSGPTEQTNVSYYWGVKFERTSTASSPDSLDVLNANVVGEKNGLLAAYTKFMGIQKLDALTTGTSSDIVNNNKFSLANVVLSSSYVGDLNSSTNTHMRDAMYVRNADLDSTTYTWTDEHSNKRITFATLLNVGTAAQYNRFANFAKFTTFMYGGFDGTNFLNRDARRINDKSVSFDVNAQDFVKGGASDGYLPEGFSYNPSGQGVENNGVKSYTTAVDIMTNPMEANNNILVIPGIREPYIADYAMKKVRDYGLAFYIMDIPSYDDSTNRLYDDSEAKPNIILTTSKFDERAIDNNYVGTYYPDVNIDDATNRRKVKVPSSVAAIGALGFNDRVSYPWFAPAGFNRAALDFVSNVDVRLNVSDRDRLYESRINPIATFPRLGFVIYGQKTLQINKSALDRVNVRRLLLEIKRIIIGIAQRIVFEQNTPAVRNKFVADASFQLGLIQAQAGVEAFQVVCNESNNTQADADLNKLNGRIVVVPTRVVEYIAIDFIITNSGVQFV